MKNETKKPMVEFDYPDSKTGKMRCRIVEVDEMTDDLIKGYEYETLWMGKIEKKYKQYRRNRIAFNGIVLIDYK